MTVRLLTVLCLLGLAAPAVASAKNGIKPLTPKRNAIVKEGTRPTFKMRVTGKGTVWVVVSTSRRRDKDGVIKSSTTTFFQQAKSKRGKVFRLNASYFDFPEFWLNSPRTYYWQAFRIDCRPGNTDDCKQESSIVKFRVR